MNPPQYPPKPSAIEIETAMAMGQREKPGGSAELGELVLAICDNKPTAILWMYPTNTWNIFDVTGSWHSLEYRSVIRLGSWLPSTDATSPAPPASTGSQARDPVATA